MNVLGRAVQRLNSRTLFLVFCALFIIVAVLSTVGLPRFDDEDANENGLFFNNHKQELLESNEQEREREQEKEKEEDLALANAKLLLRARYGPVDHIESTNCFTTKRASLFPITEGVEHKREFGGGETKVTPLAP